MSATKKVVINKCFGGFGLSAFGVQRWAELKGREAYFFVHKPGNFRDTLRVTVEEANDAFMFHAYDTPEPPKSPSAEQWDAMTQDQRVAHNEESGKHSLYHGDIPRDDPALVQVVEELGEAANGQCASLAIVEVPADVEYEISEYDGREHIAESHRTWS